MLKNTEWQVRSPFLDDLWGVPAAACVSEGIGQVRSEGAPGKAHGDPCDLLLPSPDTEQLGRPAEPSSQGQSAQPACPWPQPPSLQSHLPPQALWGQPAHSCSLCPSTSAPWCFSSHSACHLVHAPSPSF